MNVLPVLLLTCLLHGVTAHPTDLCVKPGDRLEAIEEQCRVLSRREVFTEDGSHPVLQIAHGKHGATVDVRAGKADVISFMSSPLPVAGVRIGQIFQRIRALRPDLEPHFGDEYGGYVTLSDNAAGMSLSFDVTSLRGRVIGAESYDSLRLQTVNLFEAEGEHPGNGPGPGPQAGAQPTMGRLYRRSAACRPPGRMRACPSPCSSL